jgi:hypothetical protein
MEWKVQKSSKPENPLSIPLELPDATRTLRLSELLAWNSQSSVSSRQETSLKLSDRYNFIPIHKAINNPCESYVIKKLQLILNAS